MSATILAFPIVRVPVDRRYLLPEVQARMAELQALLDAYHDEKARLATTFKLSN